MLSPGETLGEGGHAAPRHFAYSSKVAKKLFGRIHASISQGIVNTSAECFIDAFFMTQGLMPQG